MQYISPKSLYGKRRQENKKGENIQRLFWEKPPGEQEENSFEERIDPGLKFLELGDSHSKLPTTGCIHGASLSIFQLPSSNMLY